MPLWLWLIPQHPLLVILDVKNPLALIFPSWRHDHPRDQILQNLTDLVKWPSSPYELFQCCRSYSFYANMSIRFRWGYLEVSQERNKLSMDSSPLLHYKSIRDATKSKSCAHYHSLLIMHFLMQGKLVSIASKKHCKTGLETACPHGIGCCEYSYITIPSFLSCF